VPASRIDGEIDRLYQLPLDQFTTARNALAKEAGPEAADVRSLEKPSVAAWAVNQLYWQRRHVYDGLVRAAEKLRAAHKAVLTGRSGDLRETGQAHETQIDLATKATLEVLASEGQPVTDATKQAIITTLRALPIDGAPGRLTRPLQPGGFEMLAGLSLAPGKAKAAPSTSRRQPAGKPARKDASKAVERARNAAAAAARAVRDAEHAAKRAEFELARTSREAEKLTKELADSREALEHAQKNMEKAEIAWVKAGRAKESAAERARQAEKALDAARLRARAAQAELDAREG
jgi:hypothetical protein